jgi:hypothetical protein
MSKTKGKLGIVYKWNGTASNLSSEACTVNGNDAQITDSAKRLLNPNASITVTPTNSVNMLSIDYANGTIHFDGAPGVTTVSGTGAYIATGNLVKTGYLFEWLLDIAISVIEGTEFQDHWKSFDGDIGEAQGSAQGFMVGSNWFDDFEDQTDGTKGYWFIELFSYDPDDDRSGDHYDCWVMFPSINVAVAINEYIKEKIDFVTHGRPVFVPNS